MQNDIQYFEKLKEKFVDFVSKIKNTKKYLSLCTEI
jgi:hypothetical protein